MSRVVRKLCYAKFSVQDQKTIDFHLKSAPPDLPPTPLEVLPSHLDSLPSIEAGSSSLQSPSLDVNPSRPYCLSPLVLRDPPINVDSFLVAPVSNLKHGRSDATAVCGKSGGSDTIAVCGFSSQIGTSMLVDHDINHSNVNKSLLLSETSAAEQPHVVPVEQTLASNLGEWNNLPKSVRMELVEQLGDRISKTMGLQVSLSG